MPAKPPPISPPPSHSPSPLHALQSDKHRIIIDYCGGNIEVYRGFLNELESLLEDVRTSPRRMLTVGKLARFVGDATAIEMATSHSNTVVATTLTRVFDYFIVLHPEAEKRVRKRMVECFAGFKPIPSKGTTLDDNQKNTIWETRTEFDRLTGSSNHGMATRGAAGGAYERNETGGGDIEFVTPENWEWDDSDDWEDAKDSNGQERADESGGRMFPRITPGSLRPKLNGCTQFQYNMRVEIDRYNQDKPQNERIRTWTLSCESKLRCGSAKLNQRACDALWADLRVVAEEMGVRIEDGAWPQKAAPLFEGCKNVRQKLDNICGLHTSVATVSPLIRKDTAATAPRQATPADGADETQGVIPADGADETQGATPAKYANALQRAKYPSILFNGKEKKVLRRIGAEAGKPDPDLEARINDGTAVLASIDMGNNYLLTVTVDIWTPDPDSPGAGRYERKPFYLSRGEYYDKSGSYKLMRMTDRLSDKLRDELQDLAEHPAGTVDVKAFHQHVATVGTHAQRLRQVYGSQKVKKYKFTVHGGKQKVAHDFMDKIEQAVRDGERLKCQALRQGQAGIEGDGANDQVTAPKKIGTSPRRGGARRGATKRSDDALGGRGAARLRCLKLRFFDSDFSRPRLRSHLRYVPHPLRRLYLTEIVLACGVPTFNATGKGRQSTPVIWLCELLQNRFRIVWVPEHRSTVNHSSCQQTTEKLRLPGPPPTTAARRLKQIKESEKSCRRKEREATTELRAGYNVGNARQRLQRNARWMTSIEADLRTARDACVVAQTRQAAYYVLSVIERKTKDKNRELQTVQKRCDRAAIGRNAPHLSVQSMLSRSQRRATSRVELEQVVRRYEREAESIQEWLDGDADELPLTEEHGRWLEHRTHQSRDVLRCPFCSALEGKRVLVNRDTDAADVHGDHASLIIKGQPLPASYSRCKDIQEAGQAVERLRKRVEQGTYWNTDEEKTRAQECLAMADACIRLAMEERWTAMAAGDSGDWSVLEGIKSKVRKDCAAARRLVDIAFGECRIDTERSKKAMKRVESRRKHETDEAHRKAKETARREVEESRRRAERQKRATAQHFVAIATKDHEIGVRKASNTLSAANELVETSRRELQNTSTPARATRSQVQTNEPFQQLCEARDQARDDLGRRKEELDVARTEFGPIAQIMAGMVLQLEEEEAARVNERRRTTVAHAQEGGRDGEEGGRDVVDLTREDRRPRSQDGVDLTGDDQPPRPHDGATPAPVPPTGPLNGVGTRDRSTPRKRRAPESWAVNMRQKKRARTMEEEGSTVEEEGLQGGVDLTGDDQPPRPPDEATPAPVPPTGTLNGVGTRDRLTD